MDFNEFSADVKTIYAVVRALEIIGEAANKIPVDTKLNYQTIAWKSIAGMRNKLVHEYFGVEVKVFGKP